MQPVRDAGGRTAKGGAGRATGGTARRSRCGGFCHAGDTSIVCVLVVADGFVPPCVAVFSLLFAYRTHMTTYVQYAYLVYEVLF